MDGGPESAGFIDCNGGAGRQRLGRDQLRRHCARRGGSLRVLHMVERQIT